MILNNDFVVDAPAAQAWSLLTDLERVASCLPGAALDGRDGDDYVGGMKIKVGPIAAQFRGTARFLEQDDTRHSAVIQAAGKDPKGQASAQATISARLEPEGERTRVVVDTDLAISGRMAQFGRGAIADISVKLLDQFARNLGAEIAAGGQPAAAPTPPTPSHVPAAPAHVPAPRPAPAPAVEEEMNALALVGPVVLKRFGPGAGAVLAGVAVGWALRGYRDRRRALWQRLLAL